MRRREIPDPGLGPHRADLDVHVVLDNASTHKTPAIRRRLTAHPRFVLHRGTHRSVHELNNDSRDWIGIWNDNPRPCVWTKTADQILESIACHCTRINDSRH